MRDRILTTRERSSLAFVVGVLALSGHSDDAYAISELLRRDEFGLEPAKNEPNTAQAHEGLFEEIRRAKKLMGEAKTQPAQAGSPELEDAVGANLGPRAREQAGTGSCGC